MKTALRCAACLCAALWLMACGATRQPTRTEILETPRTEYVGLPAALTDPIQIPQAPEPLCKLRDGRPAPCALDGFIWAWNLRHLLELANTDRATAARLGRDAAAGLTGRDERTPPALLIRERKAAPRSGRGSAAAADLRIGDKGAER